MALPQINLESLSAIGGKPKDFFLLEFFRLYEKYWDQMLEHPEDGTAIDAATGLLMATCPNRKTREDLWAHYVAKKAGDKENNIPKSTPLTASILTVGELFDYLNTTMEFTEEAYAGA
jgi:hypothetical protein